jgi:hypothetical protein
LIFPLELLSLLYFTIALLLHFLFLKGGSTNRLGLFASFAQLLPLESPLFSAATRADWAATASALIAVAIGRPRSRHRATGQAARAALTRLRIRRRPSQGPCRGFAWIGLDGAQGPTLFGVPTPHEEGDEEAVGVVGRWIRPH